MEIQNDERGGHANVQIRTKKEFPISPISKLSKKSNILYVFVLIMIFFLSFIQTVEAAVEIIVTTTSDKVNGNISSVEALKAGPGPDSISLREAIYAGNTTGDQKNITFSEELKGTTIYISPEDKYGMLVLPSITGGNFRINGDIDGDLQPDITLNGQYTGSPSIKSKKSDYIPNNPTYFTSGLNINSRNVTIENLNINNFPFDGITVSALHDFGIKSSDLKNITINGCTISNCTSWGIIICHPAYGSLDFDQMSNLSYSDIKITNNIITNSGYGGIGLHIYGTQNFIRDTEIRDNFIDKCIKGISLCSADCSTYYFDPTHTPIQYSDYNTITNIKIINNTIENVGWSITLYCSNNDNCNNTISNVTIKNNVINGGTNGVTGFGIRVCGQFGPIREVKYNSVEDIIFEENSLKNTSWGINISNGIVSSEYGQDSKPLLYNELKNLLIKQNTIEEFRVGGIYFGFVNSGSYNTAENIIIEQNTISLSASENSENAEPGITFLAASANLNEDSNLTGVNAIENNVDSLEIINNYFINTGNAIHLIGGSGIGADNNSIKASVYGNIFTNSISELVVEENINGAENNTVELTLPGIYLNRTLLYFGATSNGSSTGSQDFRVYNSEGMTLNWSVSDNSSWLSCTPTSGTGSSTVTASVDPTGLPAGTYTGTITVSDPNASNSPQTVSVTLNVYNPNQTSAPFGTFATPIDGSTVRSSIPVTGWVLDDIGVESVKIYRGEINNLIYIGDAVFVEGARPDVEQAYPGYPNKYQAGWGYMMLTNFLPDNGNGTFKIHAIAADIEGNQVTLGIKTITCDNANAVKPFGAIDTPAQGGLAAGSNYRNQGWVLTPMPNSIPIDGSTINVIVDGFYIGHPTYNVYRQDIAALFPGYANSNGALAYFDLDTTTYSNGVHTISWNVTDDAGNTDGIGSRYFSIQNTGSQASSGARELNVTRFKYLKEFPLDYSLPIGVKKGYRKNAETVELFSHENGNTNITIKELGRVEIHIANLLAGYMKVGNQLNSLPIGSTLDTQRDTFYWQPGPGFIGKYHLVFILEDQDGNMIRKNVIVNIVSKFSKQD